MEKKKRNTQMGPRLPYHTCRRSNHMLIVTENPFSSLFARLLRLPLVGSDYNLTDGHGAYNDYPDRERCLFHKPKNEAMKDKVLKKIKKSA